MSDGRIWMFDCGEGAQRQLQHVSCVSPAKIHKIFITHMHGDHVSSIDRAPNDTIPEI